MPTSIKASPRERYAAGEVLQRILTSIRATGSERDTRVRCEVAQAAKALQRGRDPFDQQHRRGRGI